jgi:hypothetical protein
MTIRHMLPVLGILVAGSPAIASDARGLWCAPEEPEIGINANGVSFVDFDCVAKSPPFKLGKSTAMQCSGDSGGYDTEVMVTLSGDTLTVTEDGNTTTYQRCK